MELQSLHRLEEAAAIFMAPPHLVTPTQRQEAEKVFLDLQKLEHPYQTCQFILENSKNDYAKFQAVCALKLSVVREWPSLSADQREMLRKFLLQYAAGHSGAQPFVREEIYQTVAVIVKRGIQEENSQQVAEAIFSEVSQLVASGDLALQLLACSLLMALLNEFSSYSKSSGAGFTWEFHLRCKCVFETHHLRKVMLFTLQVLHELVKCEPPLDRQHLAVLLRFTSISEQIFNWEFLPVRMTRRHTVPFGALNQCAFRPNTSWIDTLLDPQLLHTYFHIYRRYHMHTELVHSLLECLGQLASINGVIFKQDDSQLKYLTNYIQSFTTIINVITPGHDETLGLSTIFENLLRWFKCSLYPKLPPELLRDFLDKLSQLTCTFIKRSATSQMDDTDEVYNEAVQKLLFAWITLIVDGEDEFPKEQFTGYCTEIFNVYLQSHLTEGRGISSEAEEEVEEDEESDQTRFAEHLSSIGVIARHIPEHSLGTLSRLIVLKTSQLQMELQISLTHGSMSNNLANIYEDIHWMMLICGSVLVEGSEHENPSIPAPLIAHSTDQSQGIDLELTAAVLADSSKLNESRIDSVIRLWSSCEHLINTLQQATRPDMMGFLSPQLENSCMWFAQRFLDAYLVPNTGVSVFGYSQMSKTLMTVFGRGSSSLTVILTRMLSKIHTNLVSWSSEPDVITQTLDVLLVLTTKRSKCEEVVKCENVWTIVQSAHDDKSVYSRLPLSSKRQLYSSLVLIGSALPEERQDQYWEKILKQPIEAFCNSVQDGTFRALKHTPAVRQSILDRLECLIGMAQSARVYNQIQLFELLEPSLSATIAVLDMCHNYEDVVNLCLEMFGSVIKSIIYSLDSDSTERLYEMSLNLIRTYYKFNSGKRTADPNAEEEKYKDIVLLLDLLVNIMSKDLIDFGLTDQGQAQSVCATEVVLYGITTLVPLLDLSLLQFPSLCSRYYKLLTFISEIQPDKVVILPQALLQPILDSILYAIKTFGSDIIKQGLEFITEITRFILSKREKEKLPVVHLLPFLEVLIKLVMFESFDLDLFDSLSGCLFYLTVLYPGEYRTYLQTVLHQHKTQAYFSILEQSVNQLSSSATVNTRQKKLEFTERVNEFLLEVKGFLCYR